MNILLVMPLSYGYHKTIVETLTAKGDTVRFIPDFDESTAKRVYRKFFSINGWQNKYIREQLRKIDGQKFDLIVVVRGYGYDYDTILMMKNSNPQARMVLYQWDPLSVSRFDERALKLFDRLFSFDKKDCGIYGMEYFPLFFKKQDFGGDVDVKYDFSFVGAGHTQRLYVLGKLISILKQNGYSYFIKVYINKWAYYSGVLKNLPGYRDFPKENLSFKPVPKEQANLVVGQSKVVIDVHHPKQTGLSIRVMEVLGASKKVITTNQTILSEPFYSPKVIGIIENCQLPPNIGELLDGDNTVDVGKFEVKNWVDYVFYGQATPDVPEK